LQNAKSEQPPIECDCGGMKLYKYGYGPNALASFHGLNGEYNDNATICYDIERGQGVDLSLFTVYAAQLNPGDDDWSKNDICSVFQAIKDDGFSSVDITGVSLGGMAVIRAMCFNDDPDLTSWPRLEIKSCGIVCGKDDRKTYESFAKVKIKAWHGTEDPTMPYVGIQTMAEETAKAGGFMNLISLEGITHNAWAFAYDTTEEDNYYAWLASMYSDSIVQPPETVAEEDPVLSFVVVNGRGKIQTESGEVYEVPLTKIEP
jgi:hypothetical protein